LLPDEQVSVAAESGPVDSEQALTLNTMATMAVAMMRDMVTLTEIVVVGDRSFLTNKRVIAA
jgi:hypothetical protein